MSKVLKMFVNELTTIDFSYLDEDKGVLGESLIVDVELSGETNNQGMLMDFSSVKKNIKKVIDLTVDHCLAVPIKNKNLIVNGDEINFLSKIGDIAHVSPQQAITLIKAEKINIKAIENFLIAQIGKILPKNIIEFNLNLRYEEISGEFIQYSHGLRKHEGNCQRIAHGHRSKVVIRENGIRSIKIEKWIAKLFQNSYFIDIADVTERFNKNSIEYISIKYQASQGDFSLILPSKYCHIVQQETTIENLVQFIFNKIKEEFFCDHLEVKFFEGVNKGAITKDNTSSHANQSQTN